MKRIRELLEKADCLTPLEVELRNEIGPILDRMERLEADAKRYQWWKRHKEITLLTSFFGNGCVNKTIAMVEAEIDAALRGEGE